MNKKIITGGLTTGVIYAFVFAGATSAFWPFDALFKKSGDVKAETTEKSYVGGSATGETSKAYMTYQTLVNMNDVCRRMFSKEYPTPTRPKSAPTSRTERVAVEPSVKVKPTNSPEKTYEMEYGIESKNEKELTSIYNNLKARCDNVANLVARMQKIYKGQTRPSVTPTPSIEEVKVTPTSRPLFNIRFREEQKEDRKMPEKGSDGPIVGGG